MEAIILTAKFEDNVYKVKAFCPKCQVINKHGNDTKGKYVRACRGHDYIVRFS